MQNNDPIPSLLLPLGESISMFKSFTGEESQEVIDKYFKQAENNVQHAINYYFSDKEKENDSICEKKEIKKELKFSDPFLKSNSEEMPFGF